MRLISKWIKRFIAENMPDALFIGLANLKHRLRGKPSRLEWGGNQIYRVHDGHDEIFIARRTRHLRYKRGILRGVNQLASQYKLTDLTLNHGGVFH